MNPIQPVIDFYEGLYRQEKEAEEKGDIAGQIIPDLLLVDTYKVIAHPEERTPENLAWAGFDIATTFFPLGKAGKVVKLGAKGGKMFESLIVKMAGEGILKEAGKIAEKIGIKEAGEIAEKVGVKEAEKTVAGKTIGEILATGTRSAREFIAIPVKAVDESAMRRGLKYGLGGVGLGYLAGRVGTGDSSSGDQEDFWDKIPIIGDIKRTVQNVNKTVDKTAWLVLGAVGVYAYFKLRKR